MIATAPRPAGFSHEAFLYRDARQFLEGVLAFIREGLGTDEPILVVVANEKIELLQAALGRQAERVRFADMVDVGLNPARLIPAWRQFVDECVASGGPFRGVGEPIWSDRSAEELVECQHHERLLNIAFADIADFRLLCPYDIGALEPEVVGEALRSHPHVVDGADYRPNANCLDLRDMVTQFDMPLPEPADVTVTAEVEAGALAELRRLVAHHARRVGFSEARLDDLVVAVNEITSNSVRHGGGHGTLRLWFQNHSLVCEVTDGGRIRDPLVGRIEPPEGSECGRGLWMATQLCDLIQVRSSETGSTIRIHMRSDG